MDILQVCNAILQTVLIAWQVKIMKSSANATLLPNRRLQRYWPIIAMALLAVVAWVPYVFHLGQPDIVNAVEQWSGTTENCAVVVDGSALMKYRAKYYLYSSCGIENASVDRMQDGLIALSNPFSIGKERIAINVKFTPEMADIYKKAQAATPAPMKPQIPNLWARPFLLPTVDISRIRRLADVREFGGKLIMNCEPIE
jgi:hypothetical protein